MHHTVPPNFRQQLYASQKDVEVRDDGSTINLAYERHLQDTSKCKFLIPERDEEIQEVEPEGLRPLFKVPKDNDSFVVVRQYLFDILTKAGWGIALKNAAEIRATLKNWIGTGWELRRRYRDGKLGSICPTTKISTENGTDKQVYIEQEVRDIIAQCVEREMMRFFENRRSAAFRLSQISQDNDLPKISTSMTQQQSGSQPDVEVQKRCGSPVRSRIPELCNDQTTTTMMPSGRSQVQEAFTEKIVASRLPDSMPGHQSSKDYRSLGELARSPEFSAQSSSPPAPLPLALKFKTVRFEDTVTAELPATDRNEIPEPCGPITIYSPNMDHSLPRRSSSLVHRVRSLRSAKSQVEEPMDLRFVAPAKLTIGEPKGFQLVASDTPQATRERLCNARSLGAQTIHSRRSGDEGLPAKGANLDRQQISSTMSNTLTRRKSMLQEMEDWQQNRSQRHKTALTGCSDSDTVDAMHKPVLQNSISMTPEEPRYAHATTSTVSACEAGLGNLSLEDVEKSDADLVSRRKPSSEYGDGEQDSRNAGTRATSPPKSKRQKIVNKVIKAFGKITAWPRKILKGGKRAGL